MKKENRKFTLFFLILILIFFAIEFKGLNHYELGDEHIYFHRAELLANGKLPYKDFFLARPPMQIFVAAILIKLFGFNFVLLKSIPLAATIISSLFLFLIMKRYGDEKAILAVLLFLFSYNTMLEATYFMGMELTIMFVLISLYFLYEKKYLAAGIFSGIAGITGLYSLVPIAAIFCFLFFKNRRNFSSFLAGFSIIFVLANLILIILFGKSYITQAYIYHLLKPKEVSSKIDVFYNIIKNNAIIFASALLFVFTKDKKKFSLVMMVSLLYLLFLIYLTKIFNFYFILLFPFLAMLGSSALTDIYKRFNNKNLKSIIAIIFLIIILINVIFTSIHLIKFDFINFQSLDKISGFIKTNSEKNELIFGDDSSIILLSRFSERNIALDDIDTNDMIFKSGVISIEETIDRLKNENLKFVIIRPLYGIGTINEFREYLNRECKLAKWFKDYYNGDFLIYDCKK